MHGAASIGKGSFATFAARSTKACFSRGIATEGFSTQPQSSPVSSDGDVPSDLTHAATDLLKEAVVLAERDVLARIGVAGTDNNASLKFLTWLFRKCPDWVTATLLDALESGYGHHAFFQKHQSGTLLLQGVGRTARNEDDQRRAFDYLLSLPQNEWKKNQMACAAFLLSRTDTAPTLLSRHEIDYIAGITEQRILEAVGHEFTTKYSYGPYLLVGLLRWRLKDPWALVAGKDPVANALLEATQRLADDISAKMDDAHI